MALIIDSSVFIDAERRHLDLADIVSSLPLDELLAIAAISVAELMVGAHLGSPRSRRREREEFVQKVVEALPVLPFDLQVAAKYAETWATLRRQGLTVAPHDLMIGSTALHHGYGVLTHNLRDFERIPGLRVHSANS